MQKSNDVKKLLSEVNRSRNTAFNVIQIGLPLTPAKVNKIFEVNGCEITLSYGGGMGGSCEKIISLTNVTREMLSYDCFTIKTINNETLTIFTRFIVKVVPKKIVVLQGEHDNEHFVYKGRQFLAIHILGENEDYMYVNSFIRCECKMIYYS
jgi:hypothetical protein